MSEFDEGRVSSISLFRRENENDLQSADGIKSLELRFKEFLSAFQISGNQTYSHKFMSKKEFLEVDLTDLGKFDPKLRNLLEEDPTTALPTFEKIASEIARSIYPSDDDDDLLDCNIQIILKSDLHDKALGSSLRALTSQRISKLVQVPGIIIAAATPQAKATHMLIQCKDCRMTQTVAIKPGLGSLALPRTCTLSSNAFQIGQKKCSLDPFVILSHKSKFVDQQTLKLQEQPEDVPPGDLPRRMLLVADRHLVDRVTPGTRVVAIGIYSVYEVKSGNKSNVRHPYFRVVGLRSDDHESNQRIIKITDDEKTKFIKFSQSPELYQIIQKVLAPEIFGHNLIKEAIACLLFGGVRKKMKDGTFRRGDVNVLLLGDPSTAKSQFLKFTSKVAPIAVYTSGKGSSAAGLTAAVIQDPSTREFYLEGGAMVLADNGVVCIDEFDKMRPEDRVAIHEAMEQQTISIAKAGISTMLKSRTSVLAAANPPKGRYDDLKTAQENIDLQTTILSRFDLIFIVKDIRNKEQDTKIAKHVIRHHKSGISPDVTSYSVPALSQEVDFLRRYIQFCRMECAPKMSESALLLLQNEYVNMREEARRVAEMGGGIAVPITVRQLEALIRLSESLAKMKLSQGITEEHVQKAIKLFKESTMDAVRAGLTEGVEFSAEQRLELQRVEDQIKQRLQLNECISEGRLIDHLGRIGHDASIVKRAVIMLLRQRDLEQVGGKNILKRTR